MISYDILCPDCGAWPLYPCRQYPMTDHMSAKNCGPQGRRTGLVREAHSSRTPLYREALMERGYIGLAPRYYA